MKNVLMLSTLMLMFVVASCSKDQAAVKKLDGVWQLDKINGNAVDGDEVTKMTFSKCKLKKDEYCNIEYSYTFFGGTVTQTGKYLVMDKGETLELKFTSQGQTSIERIKIKELTKSKMIIEMTEGTTVYTEEYKKL